MYPDLYELAMNLMVLQPTSVCVERAFSAGEIFTARRNRLHPVALPDLFSFHMNVDILRMW